ncbi:MAG: hypothetical protein PCFJNLEI_02741 [Verrucomicrobiae bacterium]|nr:hypothetical protein [Verrucomicrobiae bacterium]
MTRTIWLLMLLTGIAHAAPMTGVRRIVFCGNSLTDGSAWCDWVVETLQANGHPNLIMFNAGVAGNSTALLKARYHKDVLGVKPDLVVVNVGTVDNKPPEDYRRDLGALVEATRKTGAKMVLMTPAPIRNTNNPAYRSVVYTPVIHELAKQYDCLVVDTQAVFDKGLAEGKEMWGPDGVHHKIEAWRGMARAVLDVLDCRAPLIEKTSIYHNSIIDWVIGPAIPWTNSAPVHLKNMPEDYDPIAAGKGAYPPLPTNTDGWRQYDRKAEIAKTSWWQKCWLERGGVMPMGQDVVPGKPGSPSRDAGAFALAIIISDAEKQTTLHVGGSPPYAVWLNGQMVWNGHVLHGYHPSQDRLTVTLKKGKNRIFVFSNWLFHISLGEI